MWVINGEQTDSVQEEAVAVFATEVLVDNEHNRPLLLQERRHRVTEENYRKRVKKTSKELIPINHVIIGILPYVKKYKSESGCKFGMFRHTEADGQPSEVVEEDQLLYWRSLYNWVVYLKILIRENIFHVNLENFEQNTPSNSPKAPGTKKKFGKEMVHREVLPENVRLMSVVLARRNSRKDHVRRRRAEKDAPAEQH